MGPATDGRDLEKRIGRGGSFALEGALELELRLANDCVSQVVIRSTRRTEIAEVLRGMPVAQALQVLPTLFTICGTAHGVAAIEACEAAAGQSAPLLQRRARELVCALEALDNHALQLCVEWTRVCGAAPFVGLLRAVRRNTESLRLWAFSTDELAPAGAPDSLLRALDEAVRALAPEALLVVDDTALASRVGRLEGPVARLMQRVFELGSEDFGRTTTPLLPTLSAAWFGARLETPGFGAQPTVDGVPAEAGSLARAAAHPVVAERLAGGGATLMTRLVARVADLRELVGLAQDLAHGLRHGRSDPRALPETGEGTGVADTARGRLAHAVRVEHGRVADWRIVAPTEWSFHPAGLLREVLLGAPASGLQSKTEMLVTALDPCVPCHVRIVGNADA